MSAAEGWKCSRVWVSTFMRSNSGRAARWHLAVDFGAQSGRSLLGSCDGNMIKLRELSRFPTRTVEMNGSLHWDVLDMYRNVEEALLAAASEAGSGLVSAGVDAWAVDFGLLDNRGALLGIPYHYRDTRTLGAVASLLGEVSAGTIYGETGIQFMEANTVCQLMSMRGSSTLAAADQLLLLPDLFAWWLTGDRRAEATNAVATQLFSQRTGDWAYGLVDALNLPGGILPPVVRTGATAVPVRRDVAARLSLAPSFRVATVASHDTASAIAAVPAAEPGFAFISSGTWSLVGIDTHGPLLTSAAMKANATNQLTADGRNALLVNVMGLWLLEQCRLEWAAEGRTVSADRAVELASAAGPASALFDPDQVDFFRPGPMVDRIRAVCAGDSVGIRDAGDVVRVILESLACKYRLVLDRLGELTGTSLRQLHVVGGGGKNSLLCQLTADYVGVPVIVGPIEATGFGNIALQALADETLGTHCDIREVVRRSTPLKTYVPGPQRRRYDDRYAEFRNRLEHPEPGVASLPQVRGARS